MTDSRPRSPTSGASSTDELLAEISENTRRQLHYTRMRFLGTWLGLAILALLTSAAIVLATQTAKTNLEQTNDIAKVANDTAKNASAQSDQTVAYLRGEQGIPGVPGANGKNGTPGQPSSEPGPKGEPGAKGADGSPGATGPEGAVGAAGSAGTPGPDGSPGTAGAAGTDGLTGAQGAKGDQGPKGDAGARGDPGPAGPAGLAGPQGPPGPASAPASITVAAGSANDTTAQKNVQATCTSGRVSGGGYAILPATNLIVPTTTSTVGNGWQVTANASPAFTGAWQVLVFAVCVT